MSEPLPRRACTRRQRNGRRRLTPSPSPPNPKQSLRDSPTATVTLTAPSINDVTISLSPSSVKSLQVGSEQDFTVVVGNTTQYGGYLGSEWRDKRQPTVGTIVPITGSTSVVDTLRQPSVPTENPVMVEAIPEADPASRQMRA